jgi:hypothetical protein
MSSAYAATSTCGSIDVRMLAVYMLKSVGDSTALCGTPWCKETGCAVYCETLKEAFLESRNDVSGPSWSRVACKFLY